MNTNIYGDFQICISAPLRATLTEVKNVQKTLKCPKNK